MLRPRRESTTVSGILILSPSIHHVREKGKSWLQSSMSAVMRICKCNGRGAYSSDTAPRRVLVSKEVCKLAMHHIWLKRYLLLSSLDHAEHNGLSQGVATYIVLAASSSTSTSVAKQEQTTRVCCSYETSKMIFKLHLPCSRRGSLEHAEFATQWTAREVDEYSVSAC